MSGLVVDELCFGDGWVFGPFSFRVEPGECVGIRGPSGAGKTRLLRALADLDPIQGSVSLGTTRCADTPAPEWRRRIGLLSATPRWWLATVGEHFPDGHRHWVARFGFDPDVLVAPVERLSSGESQRLAIARLLARGPDALLLDEPTAHLDDANLGRVESVVAEVRAERRVPVLWVSHDGDQLERVASRVIEVTETRGRADPP